MNDLRSGLSNARKSPPAAASAYSPTSDGWGMNAMTASPADCAISRVWVTKRRYRLSTLSAIAPAQAVRRSIGPYWNAASSPTAKPLPVIFRTSSVSATLVSQLPVVEISCPVKYSR